MNLGQFVFESGMFYKPHFKIKKKKKKTYLHPQEKCTKTKHPALIHLILASKSSSVTPIFNI